MCGIFCKQNTGENSEGSATVEMSLVLSLILVILGALLYLGLVLHDRAVFCISGIHCLETVDAYVSEPCDLEGHFLSEELEIQGLLNKKKIEDAEILDLEKKFGEYIAERTLVTKLTETEMSIEDRRITLYYCGKAQSPGGFMKRLMGRFLSSKYELSWSRTMRADEFVRFCRGVVWKED